MDERSKGGGSVVKNRNSSGCLVVKKKRPHSTSSGSSEGDELVGFDVRQGGGPGVSQGSSVPVVYKRGVGHHGEFSSRINDFDDVGFGRSDLMREVGIKRSKLDVYDFDEYDDFSDVEGLGMRHFYERDNVKTLSSSGQGIEFDSGGFGKGDIIYKRRDTFRGSTTSEKIKRGGDRRSRKQRFGVKPENPRLMGKEKVGGSRDAAIRLQGRNGVLKVMVKNKEIKGKLKPRNEGSSVVSRSREITPKNVSIHHSSYSERRLQKRPMGIGGVDEDRLKKRITFSVKSSDDSDEESEDSDTSLKLQSEGMEAHLSMKRGRDEGTLQSRQIAQPTKSKEMKVKRGSRTEKQLLREKIRNMLLDASWTIDYRPRRGRDYSDAVYINPSGTAYWSIIKAYEALQKQLEEDGKSLKAAEESPSFDPISDDILRKLTRQTKKKMEKELQRKKREEGKGKLNKEFSVGNFEEDDDSDTDSTGSGRHDDRLSSFMKRSGKSFKGASKEAYPNLNDKMSERDERSSSISNSRFIHGRKSKKIGRCTLLIRNPQKEMDSESDKYVPYTGKRNLLSWLIDSGTVKLSEKVHYMNRRRTRMMLEGWITRDGIHCGCCSKILTVSKFEIHAASKLRQPFQNIYSSSGLSLLQCQVEAWNRQDESLCGGFHKIDVNGDDPNDDTCAICGDGGNLICCDGCPSTFHLNCLDIQMLPAGDWHCPHCSCKFCSLAELSGTEANDKTKDTVLTCSLCERKYHSACVEEMDDTPVNANSSVSFCGKKCQEVFDRLQKLMGVKCELDGGLFWSLIQRTTLGTDTSVRGYPQRVEWNSKLAVALSVMDECFLPITDRRSGIHTIHNVLYNCGSNFTRLNYNGFYTAILEKGDEIICAASIRIHGTQFAEMPFIGTRHIYRRQGMCRRLFSAIELGLHSLKVEKLIIPAISELMETWITVFGFRALGESDKREMKTLNTLAFPGTDMLQKQLLQGQITSKKNLAGMNALEDGQHTSSVFDLTDIPDPDAGPSSVSAWPDDDNMKEKSITDMCFQDHIYPDITSGRVFSNKIGPLALNECVDADDNEELHSSPDAADEIQEIGKYLNDSPVKHDMDESEKHNLPQEAESGETDVALTPTDVPMPGTSYTALLDSFLGNDNHAHNDETICSNNESSADVEQHDLLKATHNDDITTENPNIELLAEGNNIQHSLEDEVDGAREVLPASGGAGVARPVTDSSSSSHVTREQKVQVSESEADGVVRSLKDESHGFVEMRDPLPDSHDQVRIEASSFQPDNNVSCENLGLEKPELDSCDISKVNPEEVDLIRHQLDTCEISTGNLEEVDLIKYPLDSSGISTINPEEVGDLIKHPPDSCEISKVNPGEVDPLDTCEISTGNLEEVDLIKCPLDSCEISTVNPGEVSLTTKHPLDSCTDNMPISDGELRHPHDNGVEIANTPPISNSSFKASSPNDEVISHSTENPSSLSSDTNIVHHSTT